MGRVPGGDLSELVPTEPLEVGQARLQGSSKDQRKRGLGSHNKVVAEWFSHISWDGE